MDAQSIKQYQQFLKQSNPLNVKYTGNDDGNFASIGFKDALFELQNKLNSELTKQNKPIITILSNYGTDIALPLNELIKNIESITNVSTIDPNNNIKSIQQLFNSNPFGLKWEGPIDGITSPEFIKKLQELEMNIQNTSGAKTIGKIVANNQIITSPNELTNIFELIKSFMEFAKTSIK